MKFKLLSFSLVITLILFNACRNEEAFKPPVISFKAGTQYTQNEAVVAVGHTLRFGLEARGTDAAITNLTIKKVLENGTVVTMMDTALYSNYVAIDKVFFQNVENKAVWTFAVMDRNRMTTEITLTVNKDPNSTYGGIYYFPFVTLGFQGNTSFGHFLNPSSGMVFSNDSSTIHQDDIDVLCYFKTDDTPPSAVLSSPGEMDNFSTDAQTQYPQITNWTTRHYTLWDISLDNGNNTPLTSSDFDAAQNDSLLIVSYHPIWGKKKFKYADPGKIIPFITSNGKLGLIKVISTGNDVTGSIEFALKIQQ